jgi:hypothetical protein
LSLTIRPTETCELDLISLGECMVRLSPPGHGRIEFAGSLEVHVGGGDGFASGFAYGFLTGTDPQTAVNLGTAHGALLQTTRGDTSQITLKELQHVAGGGGARIVR